MKTNVRKAPAATFLVNLSKVGDRTLQEAIKNVLQLICDKKIAIVLRQQMYLHAPRSAQEVAKRILRANRVRMVA